LKLGNKPRTPGTSTSFVDASADEPLLQVAWDKDGLVQLAFRIYDGSGQLVADSGGLAPVCEGVTIVDEAGEILLDVPANADEHIHYRLYNSKGLLLTYSDGSRTQIFGFLKMEAKRSWQPRTPA